MPGTYVVNHADPAVPPITIPPQSVDNSTSVTMFGYRYPVYGEELMENFLHLLENFASPTPPTNPVNGQIWMDTSTGTPVPKFYASGAGIWIEFGAGEVTPPVDSAIVTINGAASGASIEVIPGGTISVRIQNVPVGDSIVWSGGSAGDTLISNLQTNAGTSTNATEFTAVVGVGATARVVPVTATIGSAVFTFDITVTATATDFSMSAISGFSVVNGATATTEVTVNLTGITGAVGSTVVSVTGSGLVSTPANTTLNLDGGTSSTASTAFTLNTSALAVGTHTITASAVSGTITRTRTFVITVTASGTLPNPVIVAVTDRVDGDNNNDNEISLGHRYGLRITNVPVGATVSIALSHYAPSGIVQEPELIQSGRDSNVPTTVTLTYPSDPWMFNAGPFVTGGQLNRGMSQATITATATVNGIQSNTIDLILKRPVVISGSSLVGNSIVVDQIPRSLTVAFYAPKYAGNTNYKPGNAYLATGYTTRAPLGGNTALPSNGADSFTTASDGTNADLLYTAGGNNTMVQYGFGPDSAALSVVCDELDMVVTPSVSAVAPPYAFALGSLGSKVKVLWTNTTGTPYGSLSEPAGSDYQFNNPTVTLSQIMAGGLQLSVQNLGLTGATNNTRIFAAGTVITGLRPVGFNEANLSLSSDILQPEIDNDITRDNRKIAIVARSRTWTEAGGGMVYDPSTFATYFTTFGAAAIGIRIAVGVERAGQFLVATYVSLVVTNA